jgi:hypothetical protein
MHRGFLRRRLHKTTLIDVAQSRQHAGATFDHVSRADVQIRTKRR